MESKKINQLATELAPELSDLTIIGDPTTGISKKITLSQMASLFTGTVEEYANLASFPLVGTADTIYIALDTNIIYRWNTGTNAYVELSPNIVTSLVFNDANGFDGTISLVGSTATLTITTALTTGSVGFIGASGALLEDNTNFFWNNSTKRLGIGTNAPTTAIDVFGSGIIGRLNGTSTNNAFLGFASAGTNRWSIGNVQSDHRFRIYSEANTAELVSVLQTGEVGIGIANPLTKLHIFGGASALIANLDANTSVAKSISFRSGNSSRINLEVSGTESGSNAGANLFIRTYTDAGSLLATPLTITRSTGAIALTGALSGTSATFSGDLTLDNGSADGGQLVLASSGFSNWNIDNFSGNLRAYYGSTERMTLTSSGNLGIGINAPLSRLHLIEVGGASVVPTLTISQDGDLGLDWTAGALNFYSYDGSTNSRGGIGHIRVAAETAYNTGATPSYMAFYTHSNIANNNTTLGAATEKMRISASGNVGIGVIPAAWGTTSIKALQVGTFGSLAWTGGVDVNILNNAYYDGTNFKYLAGQEAANYYINRNTHIWRVAPLGSAGNNITWTEAMRVNSSGNLYIGTTTGDGYKLQISGNTQAQATFGMTYSGVAAYSQWVNSSGAFVMGLDAAAGATERLRVTSSGQFFVRTTDPFQGAETMCVLNNGSTSIFSKQEGGSAAWVQKMWNNSTSGDSRFAEFLTETALTARGSIDYNRGGGVVRYNTTSDATLKNIIGEADKQKSVDILASTKIKEYSWKDDETNKPQIGVIAQELYETFKGAVTVGGDHTYKLENGEEFTEYVPWGVDKTAFTFHLIAGWQKHQEIIANLEARIKQLESK